MEAEEPAEKQPAAVQSLVFGVHSGTGTEQRERLSPPTSSQQPAATLDISCSCVGVSPDAASEPEAEAGAAAAEQKGSIRPLRPPSILKGTIY